MCGGMGIVFLFKEYYFWGVFNVWCIVMSYIFIDKNEFFDMGWWVFMVFKWVILLLF